jgi:heavy metal sensor kinase
MRPGSLRFRLSGWYAGLSTAVLVALATLLFVHLRTYLERTLEETQLRRARQIAETIAPGADRAGDEAVALEVARLYAPEKSDRFIRLTRGDGRLVYVSGPPNDLSFDPAAVPPATPSPAESFSRRQPVPGGADLLIAAVRRQSVGGSYLVEVGTSSAPVARMFRHLLVLLGAGIPVVVVLAVAGGYLLVGRALRPVETIARKAEAITQHNLGERLPVPRTGDELERLSVSLNHMITRLDDAFRNSKRFVADASHELRTPLTVLRGELEVLVQEEFLPAELRDRFGSLLEEVERISRIVEQLFALSRLDAGEAQAESIRFDLRDLAAGVADGMTLLAEDKAISVACEPGPAVFVKGDRARLKQVVVNLLDNAIKYTPAEGAVGLRVCSAGSWAFLEVADTGIGIEAVTLPHVFERFYRADSSRFSQPDGAGLGLAIVKAICTAHGGNVEVESTPGHGSLFRARFPLAGAPGAPIP